MLYFLHKNCRQEIKSLRQANCYLESQLAATQAEVARLQAEGSRLSVLAQEQAAQVEELRASLGRVCLRVVAQHVCNLPKGHPGDCRELGVAGEVVFLGR